MPYTQILLSEIENAQPITAPEMGFMLDSGANPIYESRITLAQVLDIVGKVKFILAQEECENNKVHLGIFYPSQAAATSAFALCYYLAGQQDKFGELASKSAEICYGKPVDLYRPTPKDPLIEGVRIIGGGEISHDPQFDQPNCLTLSTNFGITALPLSHMQSIRRRVLHKILDGSIGK